MNEKDKKQIRMMEITGGVLLILYALCQWVLFPYIAVIKAENGKFKEACAYVVHQAKEKNHIATIVKINGKEYKSRSILPLYEWLKFPLGQDFKGLLTVEPNTCKKVQYVEVYNIFGFKKFYLYDYLNQQAPKT